MLLSRLNLQEEPGPAQRRKNRQRRRIFAEAVRLFEENGGEHGNGHEKTTIEAIASRSDISVRTFFRYFQSKYDVIYADLPGAMEDHLALTARLLGDYRKPAEAAMAATVIQLTDALTDAEDRARMLRAMSSSVFVERRGSFRIDWRNRLADLFRPHLGRGRQTLVHARALASAVLDIRDAALEAWAVEDGGRDLLVIFEECLAAWQWVWARDMPRTIDMSLDRRLAEDVAAAVTAAAP